MREDFEEIFIPDPPDEPDYIRNLGTERPVYFDQDNIQNPYIFEPGPIRPDQYNDHRSQSVNIVPKPYFGADDNFLFIKIFLPISLTAILLLLLGVLLLWYFKLRNRQPSANNEKGPGLVYRTKNFFSKKKPIPTNQNVNDSNGPLETNNIQIKPIQKKLSTHDQSTARLLSASQSPRHTSPHHPSNYPDVDNMKSTLQRQPHHQSPPGQVSYVMPKSQYFNKPNPYRNMPPPIDCNIPYTRNSRF